MILYIAGAESGERACLLLQVYLRVVDSLF